MKAGVEFLERQPEHYYGEPFQHGTGWARLAIYLRQSSEKDKGALYALYLASLLQDHAEENKAEENKIDPIFLDPEFAPNSTDWFKNVTAITRAAVHRKVQLLIIYGAADTVSVEIQTQEVRGHVMDLLQKEFPNEYRTLKQSLQAMKAQTALKSTVRTVGFNVPPPIPAPAQTPPAQPPPPSGGPQRPGRPRQTYLPGAKP